MPVTSSSRRDRRQIAEHDERLVERGRHVVRAGPARCTAGSAPSDVVVRQEVREPQVLDGLAVRPNRRDVTAELGLREHHADPHRCALVSITSTSSSLRHG